MKRQSFKMVLTSGLVFLLLGVTAPLTYGAPPSPPQGPISLPFSGTVFNKCTGEDVDITGEVHVLFLLTPHTIFTRLFLKSYDANGVTTSAAYAVALEDPSPPASVTPSIDGTDSVTYAFITTYTYNGAPTQKGFRCHVRPIDRLHILLFFSADGFLTGWSTTLNGTTCTNKDPCIPPQ